MGLVWQYMVCSWDRKKKYSQRARTWTPKAREAERELMGVAGTGACVCVLTISAVRKAREASNVP